MKPVCKTLEELHSTFHNYVVDSHDFIIGRELGDGGFSRVYLGRAKSTGHLCAIKVLNYANLNKDRFLLYEREVRILAVSSNPFLLHLVGFTTRHPYTIVTEYIPRGSLHSAVRDKTHPLTPTQQTVIAYGIANGLQHLHELDIIHRDLKTANVLLDESLGPKIADFGLSRCAENDCEEDMTAEVGTAHWMAPELLEGKQYTEKVDVYSYGMLLWELLVGKSPFRGIGGMKVAVMVTTERKRPEIPKRTPKNLRNLIQNCWSADPKKRPSFRGIVQLFETHKVRFSGASDQDFDRIVANLKIPKEPLRERLGLTELPIETPAALPVASIDPSGICFPDPYTATFIGELSDITAAVTGDTISQYFAEVIRVLTHGIAPEELSALLKLVIGLLEQSHRYVLQFLKQQVYTRLPMHESCLNEIFTIFLYVFTFDSGAIMQPILNQVIELAERYPRKALRLLNLYLRWKPEPPHLVYAFESLVSHENLFLGEDCCQPYIQSIYSVMAVQPQLKTTHLDKVCLFFGTLLESKKHELIDPILGILFEDLAFERLIGNVPFETLLGIDETREGALILLYRYHDRMRINTSFLKTLILVAKESKPAAYVLLQLCENEKIALTFVRMIDQWIGENLPTLRMTVKLLLMVARFESPHRQIIASSERFPLLLVRIASQGDMKILPKISGLLKLFIVDSNFVRECEDFFRCYYPLVIEKCQESQELVYDAMVLTEMLSRVAFSPYYLSFIPILELAIKRSEWSEMSISVIVALSGYEEARLELKKHQFLESVQVYGSGENLDRFMNNMQS